MMMTIIPKVTPLAHGPQVRRIAVLGLVIKVRNGEHNAPVGELGLGVILLSATPATMQSASAVAFAEAARPFENSRANLSPVSGVSQFVFRMSGHYAPGSNLGICPVEYAASI